MQKNSVISNSKIKLFLTFFALSSALTATVGSAFAGGDLSIKLKKNSDLLTETKLVDLKSEVTMALAEDKKPNQVALGASSFSLGHPQISTFDQDSTYNLTNETAVSAEFSTKISKARITGTIGYAWQDQTGVSTTRLNLIPIGALGEYVFLKDRKISPFLGAGALELIEIQRGTDLNNVTKTDTVPVLTAGIEFATPWDIVIHTRVRQLEPLADASKEWGGRIYDLGIAYSM